MVRGKYKLVRLSSLTRGIIDRDGNYIYNGEGEDEGKYDFFDEINIAYDFVQEEKKNKKNITYILFSDKEEVLFEDESKFEPIKFPKEEKKWWQFWKKE